MRVVSLLPAATEMVAALGGLELLVGVTHECDHPAVVCSRVRVTSAGVDGEAPPGDVDRATRALVVEGRPLFTLYAERIRTLRPDVLLTQRLCDVCAVSETDVRALAATMLPAPRVVALAGTGIDSVIADISAVADALDLRDEAEELLDGLRARLATVHGTLKRAAAARPRVAVIEWGDPVYAAGHWVPEMVRRAGGEDVLAKPGEHSRLCEAAAVQASGPSVLVIAPCGYGLARARDEAQRLLARPEWSWARACAVWAMDSNGLVSRPGPRLIDGVETLARIMHPSLFGPPLAAHAVVVA